MAGKRWRDVVIDDLKEKDVKDWRSKAMDKKVRKACSS